MPYTPPAGLEARGVDLSVEAIDVTSDGMFGGPRDEFKKYAAGLVTARVETRRSGSTGEWTVSEATEATAERALEAAWKLARQAAGL